MPCISDTRHLLFPNFFIQSDEKKDNSYNQENKIQIRILFFDYIRQYKKDHTRHVQLNRF